jgi:glucosamine--fructose-6-phosphate aminotransferase (isomerizing)
VLGISQSGKSPDIVSVLAEARRQGCLTAAITNIPQSDLGQNGRLRARPARGRREIGGGHQDLHRVAGRDCPAQHGIQRRRWPVRRSGAESPNAAAQTLALPGIDRVAERYRYMSACIAIGRGFNYCTAFELALKLKELTYTVVEPYSSADFPARPAGAAQRWLPHDRGRAVGPDAAGDCLSFMSHGARSARPSWW